MIDYKTNPEAKAPRVFATTHWSVVIAAGEGDSEPAQRALETLCNAYWYPIYVFVRRKGYGPQDAQDLTQEFFAQLIAKDHVSRADRSKGRFRTFLLAMLDYFVAREWSRAHRQKRGGQFTFLSLDQHTPEERYLLEPAHDESPEKDFERQWALTVLQLALDALEKECVTDGKAVLFAQLRGFLSGDREAGVYVTLGQRLDMSEASIRVAVHRLRRRYGELLRDEIARTVASAEDAAEELRHLKQLLSE